MNEPQHRLAAVWFADIVDYSRLSAINEAEALRLVEIFQAVVKESVEKHDGRVVKFLGDGVLAEFPSTQSAVRAGIDLQKEYTKRTAESPPGDGHSLRVGIHVGDVATMPDGDLYGDGVNIGARLQQAAGAGQVVISEDVWRQIRQRPEFEFKDLGEQELKGALGPMTIYGVDIGEGLGSRTSATGIDPRRFSIGRSHGGSHRRGKLAHLGAGLAVAVVAVGITVFLMRGGEEEPPPPAETSTPEAITGQLFEAVGRLQEMQQADEAQQQLIESQRQRLEELEQQQAAQEETGAPVVPGLAEEMEELRGVLEGLKEMGAPGVVFDSLAGVGIVDSVTAAIEAAGVSAEEPADEDAEVVAPPPPAPQVRPDAQPPAVDRDAPKRRVPPADRRRPPGQRP